MMIQKKDIPLISHAQAAEIDRELEDTYGGGAIFRNTEGCLYGAYRQSGKLHVVRQQFYDAYGNRHTSIGNLGLWLDHRKEIYHITLDVNDERNSLSNITANKLGFMSRERRLARISMAKQCLSDVFKQIDNGKSTKDLRENMIQ